MKNILGKEEDLKLYNKEGDLIYQYFKGSSGYIGIGISRGEYTYNSNGNILTYKNSDGWSYEYTYDSNGNELTFKNSDGWSYEYTRDSNGNELTFKNSDFYSHEYTRDSKGNELTYKNSNGIKRGFNIPEYTMEELVEKLGNFKIKK